MAKKWVTILVAVVVSSSLVFFTSCESDAQTGALIGTAAGAGAGQAIGGDTEATLIGSAVGGGVGYVVGNEKDKDNRKVQNAQIRAEQNTTTVWITNSNGSKHSVKLTKQGPGYIGPRGEYYETLPTEAQLKPLYGF